MTEERDRMNIYVTLAGGARLGINELAWRPVRRKSGGETGEWEAVRIDEYFELQTPYGNIAGNPGDWLLRGLIEAVNVLPPQIFEKQFEVVA